MSARRPAGAVSERRATRRGRRVGRALWPVLATLAMVVVLFTAVFPTRTLLAQRSATAAAHERLEVLAEQNAELEARADELQSEAEIERLAREEYNLVKPGERAYALLPGPTPPTTTPADEEEPDDRNAVERLWDGVTGIF